MNSILFGPRHISTVASRTTHVAITLQVLCGATLMTLHHLAVTTCRISLLELPLWDLSITLGGWGSLSGNELLRLRECQTTTPKTTKLRASPRRATSGRARGLAAVGFTDKAAFSSSWLVCETSPTSTGSQEFLQQDFSVLLRGKMRQVRFKVAKLRRGWLVVLCGSTYRLIVREHGVVMMHGFLQLIMW